MGLGFQNAIFYSVMHLNNTCMLPKAKVKVKAAFN